MARRKRSSKVDGEADLARQLTMLRIDFDRQFQYVPGRKFSADFHLPPYSLLIEVQGGIYPFARQRADGQTVILPGAHGSVEGIKADNTRLNLATLHGYQLLRFTPDDVGDETAITFIIDVLRTRGWRG